MQKAIKTQIAILGALNGLDDNQIEEKFKSCEATLHRLGLRKAPGNPNISNVHTELENTLIEKLDLIVEICRSFPQGVALTGADLSLLFQERGLKFGRWATSVILKKLSQKEAFKNNISYTSMRRVSYFTFKFPK